jgi:hypothetical protein
MSGSVPTVTAYPVATDTGPTLKPLDPDVIV